MAGEKISNIAILAAVIFGVAYLLFYVILPHLFPLGLTDRPFLGEGQPVGTEHIDWLAMNLGAASLHPKNSFSKNPEIEMVVNPGGNYFAVMVENGVPRTRQGRALDPDIRLTGDRSVVAEILASQDIFSAVKRMNREGRVQLEMLRSREDLSAMGYNALYEELTG